LSHGFAGSQQRLVGGVALRDAVRLRDSAGGDQPLRPDDALRFVFNNL
jgi:hypothetical protein